jgi:hypothetical protein
MRSVYALLCLPNSAEIEQGIESTEVPRIDGTFCTNKTDLQLRRLVGGWKPEYTDALMVHLEGFQLPLT